MSIGQIILQVHTMYDVTVMLTLSFFSVFLFVFFCSLLGLSLLREAKRFISMLTIRRSAAVLMVMFT